MFLTKLRITKVFLTMFACKCTHILSTIFKETRIAISITMSRNQIFARKIWELTECSILQPDGVVEFVEVDPRPRAYFIERRRSETDSHVSRPVTNWTDDITDRFESGTDEQLATMVPGWIERVQERLKAVLRPRDGIAAVNLQSWVEGAG
jgi:hypothetical protein